MAFMKEFETRLRKTRGLTSRSFRQIRKAGRCRTGPARMLPWRWPTGDWPPRPARLRAQGRTPSQAVRGTTRSGRGRRAVGPTHGRAGGPALQGERAHHQPHPGVAPRRLRAVRGRGGSGHRPPRPRAGRGCPARDGPGRAPGHRGHLGIGQIGHFASVLLQYARDNRIRPAHAVVTMVGAARQQTIVLPALSHARK